MSKSYAEKVRPKGFFPKVRAKSKLKKLNSNITYKKEGQTAVQKWHTKVMSKSDIQKWGTNVTPRRDFQTGRPEETFKRDVQKFHPKMMSKGDVHKRRLYGISKGDMYLTSLKKIQKLCLKVMFTNYVVSPVGCSPHYVHNMVSTYKSCPNRFSCPFFHLFNKASCFCKLKKQPMRKMLCF